MAEEKTELLFQGYLTYGEGGTIQYVAEKILEVLDGKHYSFEKCYSPHNEHPGRVDLSHIAYHRMLKSADGRRVWTVDRGTHALIFGNDNQELWPLITFLHAGQTDPNYLSAWVEIKKDRIVIVQRIDGDLVTWTMSVE